MEHSNLLADPKTLAAVLALGMENNTGVAESIHNLSREHEAAVGTHTSIDIPGYRMIESIGEGGMGTVWRAEEAKTHRQVALKVLTARSLGSDRHRQRFEREIELAARLEHRHIARIYDSGSSKGLWYYAMELVSGEHLDRYIEAQKLGRRQILLLMREVCAAVHYAHQRGVIHRDLKPSNILVTADGQPSIVDFGLAKALEDAPTDLMLTEEGQYTGTPAFMSPEQALGRVGAIDTRSDVYSLGATLYLLLTGDTPHDQNVPRLELIRRVAYDDVRRPRETKEELPAELEWLLLKALAHEPEERYGSAAELAEDIGRYLSGDPLRASPPSVSYRLLKFARKRGIPLAVATAFVLLLVTATAASSWQAAKATRARREADVALASSEISRGQAEAVSAYLIRTFQSIDPHRDGRDIRVEEILDRAVAGLTNNFAGSAATKGKLLAVLGRTYTGLGLTEKGLELLQQARAIGLVALGPDHPDTLRVSIDMVESLRIARRLKDAVPLLEDTLNRCNRRLAPNDPLTLRTMIDLGDAYRAAGRPQDAVPILEHSLKLCRTNLDPDNILTLDALNDLALAYQRAGRLAEAVPLFEEAARRTKAKFGPDFRDTLIHTMNLANAYRSAGRAAAAVAILDETFTRLKSKFGPDHPDTLDVMSYLAESNQSAGTLTAAVSLSEEVLRRSSSKLGLDHPISIRAAATLGSAIAAAMKQDGLSESDVPSDQIRSALDRLIEFYDSAAKRTPASAWRQRLEELEVRARGGSSTRPSTNPYQNSAGSNM